MNFNNNQADMIIDLSTNGSFTLQETDSGMDSDSDPIPVVGSYDWNLNLTLTLHSAM